MPVCLIIDCLTSFNKRICNPIDMEDTIPNKVSLLEIEMNCLNTRSYILTREYMIYSLDLRCIATIWKTEDTEASDYGYSVSQPEDPRRAIVALRNLARGHALLTGRNYITKEDIPVVVKTVLSTAQIERVSVFYLLINNNGDVSTDDVMDYLHVSRPTALRTMAELKVIRLVEDYEFQ